MKNINAFIKNPDVVFNQYPIPSALFGLDGEVTFINNSFKSLVENIGFIHLLSSDDQGKLSDILTKLTNIDYNRKFSDLLAGRADSDVMEVNIKNIRSDKTVLMIMLQQIRDHDDKIFGGIIIIEDVTHKKRLFEDLASSEDRYKKLVHEAMVGIILISSDGNILFTNQTMSLITGFSMDDLLTKNLITDFAADESDQKRLRQNFEGIVHDATTWLKFKFKIKNSRGKIRQIESVSCKVKHFEKIVIQSIVQDVTQQVEYEQKLKDQIDTISSLNRLSQAVCSTLETQLLYSILYDQIKQIIPTDAFFIAIKHPETDDYFLRFAVDIINGKPRILAVSQQDSKISEPVKRFIKSKQSVLFNTSKDFDEIKNTYQFGDENKRSESMLLIPIIVHDQPIGMISCQHYKPNIYTHTHLELLQNISNLAGLAINNANLYKKMESTLETLHSTRDQLIHAQKMESIGALTGGIAHDFNNILSGVLGYASFIKTMISPEDKMYNYIDIIEKSGERAYNLTQQLLGFSRKGKYNIAPLNLNKVLNDTIHLVEKSLDKKITITVIADEKIKSVEADSEQLQQVFTNIIVNSRDAMPNGGEIIIETTNIHIDKMASERIVGSKHGDYVVVSFSDTGVGIPPELVNKVFEPYFTTKPKGKGTGLGLSMVYGIIKHHDGFVRIKSSLGQGTTITIYLPASEKQEVVSRLEDKDTKDPEFRGTETILIIDDEDVIRQLWKNTLESFGYKVLIAEDGIKGIDVYSANKDRISLIILDIVMPELDGPETFKKLKEINDGVKVIVSSGYSRESHAREMLEKGALTFIKKPIKVQEFLKTIRMALD